MRVFDQMSEGMEMENTITITYIDGDEEVIEDVEHLQISGNFIVLFKTHGRVTAIKDETIKSVDSVPQPLKK